MLSWWLIGRALTPKPFFSAKYLIDEFEGMDIQDGIREVKLGQKVEPEPYTKTKVNMHARIMDRGCRYLMVAATDKMSDRHFLEADQITIYDLHGDLNTPLEYKQKNHWTSELLIQRNLQTDANGNLFFVKDFYPSGKMVPFFEDDRSKSHQEHWHWNILSNQAKQLEIIPKTKRVTISKDSSTMLEVERLSALSASWLAPSSLATVLGKLAEFQVGTHDLAVMRVWSLPEFELRCTITLPWKDRRDTAELSDDGEVVILADALATGDTEISSHQHRHHRAYRSSRTLMFQIVEPRKLRLYSAHSGQLCFEYQGYEGNYDVDREAEAPLNKEVITLAYSSKTPGASHHSIHLPTKTMQKHQALFSFNKLNSTLNHAVEHSSQPYLPDSCQVYHQTSSGTSNLVATIEGNGARICQAPSLVAYAPQCIVQRLGANGELLPAWLIKFLRKHDWFTQWMDTLFQKVTVENYLTKQQLITHQGGSNAPVNYQLTDHWVLFTQNDGTYFHVNLYALPVTEWSPWWARLVGVLTALLIYRFTTAKRLNTPSNQSTSYLGLCSIQAHCNSQQE